jgi:hypothetical protein
VADDEKLFLWSVRRVRELAHGTDGEQRQAALYLKILREHFGLLEIADAVERYCLRPPPGRCH